LGVVTAVAAGVMLVVVAHGSAAGDDDDPLVWCGHRYTWMIHQSQCDEEEAQDRREAEHDARSETDGQSREQAESHERRVELEVERLGAHRAEDARRLVGMREAAEKAAGLTHALLIKGEKPRMCGTEPTTRAVSGFGFTREAALKFHYSTSRCQLVSEPTCTKVPWDDTRVQFRCSSTIRCAAEPHVCGPYAGTQQ
jgi:hypothetical protein